MAHELSLPKRISGSLALDLANTISWRGTAREIDHLRDVDAILAWARAAGLIDARFTPNRTRSFVDDVHKLRRAIDQAGSAIARRRAPPPAALATIRDLAARALAGAELTGNPARLVFPDADPIVGPIAWSALDLLRGNELSRLKQCPPNDCRWLFIDRTRNGSRRWCEMASCGDRAKKRLLTRR